MLLKIIMLKKDSSVWTLIYFFKAPTSITDLPLLVILERCIVQCCVTCFRHLSGPDPSPALDNPEFWQPMEHPLGHGGWVGGVMGQTSARRRRIRILCHNQVKPLTLLFLFCLLFVNKTIEVPGG